jgi:hypothetical protein
MSHGTQGMGMKLGAGVKAGKGEGVRGRSGVPAPMQPATLHVPGATCPMWHVGRSSAMGWLPFEGLACSRREEEQGRLGNRERKMRVKQVSSGTAYADDSRDSGM